MEERLATREYQTAEAKLRTNAEPQEEAEAESQNPSQEKKSATSEKGSKPITIATGSGAKVAADRDDKDGDEEVGAIPEANIEATGVASAGLSVITEEDFPPSKILRGDTAVGNQADSHEKGDEGESRLGRAERRIDHVVDRRTKEDPAEPNMGNLELTQRQEQNLLVAQENGFPLQSEDALKETPSQREESKAGQSQLRSPAESATAETDASRVRDSKKAAEASPARLEVAKQRAEIAVLIAEAKEGMAFVSRSVDMADVLRGFEFTPRGVPVRDPAVKRELLQEGRSALRDRHRKLRAVEAAKKRGRASDVRLMERAFRQVTARQTSGRATKARKAAAMAMYRDIEEAWERMQEEKESTKRIEAAKRKLEHQVLAAAEEEAFAAAAQTALKGGTKNGVSLLPSPSSSEMLTESGVLASPTPAATATGTNTSPSVNSSAVKKVSKGEEEDDEEDDPELQRVLARKAGEAGNKKTARRR